MTQGNLYIFNFETMGIRMFCWKLFVFILLFFVTDRLLGRIADFLYFKKSASGLLQKINYSAYQTQEDVLIFGSSCAASHYVPSILEDTLGLSVYNVGLAAHGIFTYYLMLSNIEERYFPKLIILDLKPEDYLVSSNDRLDGLKHLAPFYGRNNKVDSLFTLYSSSEKIKMFFYLYRFNSQLANILSSNMGNRVIEKGYEPLHGVLRAEITHNNIDFNIDSLKIKYIDAFIKKVLTHNCKIFLAVSPAFYFPDSEVYNLFKNTQEKYHIPLLYHYSDSIYWKEDLFHDRIHLNEKGANKYTTSIAHSIKKNL